MPSADATAAAPIRPTGIELGDEPPSSLGRTRNQLRVVLERRGTALLVYARGSVDASNVAGWRRLVAEAAGITKAPGPLIIDVSGIEFMAVCAFAVLAEESARCRRRGIDLWLVSDQRLVRRVMTVAGFDVHFSFSTTTVDALGDTSAEDPGPVLGSGA